MADHQNIRKLRQFRTTWIPFKGRIGHYFCEKITYSLKEATNAEVMLDPFHHAKGLLLTIEYLHSQPVPIYHRNININTVYIDMGNDMMTLKVGNFDRAKMDKEVAIETPSMMINLLTRAHVIDVDDNLREEEDLQAASRVIFYLLTKTEQTDEISVNQLLDIPEVELTAVVLALQRGMSAKDGLKCSAFQSFEEKHTLLGELNGHFKDLKLSKEAGKNSKLEKAEENAWLVTGQKGAWNIHFDKEILKKFALTGGGYVITSFVDLLRVIRNILQHLQENPEAVMAAFGTSHMPSVQVVLQKYLKIFPHLYPHSFCCYYELFNVDDLPTYQHFIQSYQAIESQLKERNIVGSSNMKQKSKFTIKFSSIHSPPVTYDAPDSIKAVRSLKSSMCLDDIIDDVKSRFSSLWPDILPHEVIVKVNDEFIKNPFSDHKQGKSAKAPQKSNSGAPEKAVSASRCKEHLLEGYSVEILRPDIKVDVCGIKIDLKIMENFTGRVVKQRIINDLKGKHPKGKVGDLFLNEIKVEDKVLVRNLDFASHNFHLEYKTE